MHKVVIALAFAASIASVLLFTGRRAHGQLASAPWPMFHHDPGRTGASEYSTNGNNGALKWKFPTGGAVHSSPAIGADGTVYVGSDDNNLYAINPDGIEKWLFPTGGPVDSSPAIGPDGTIYASSDDGILYAVNPDGSLKWTSPGSGGNISPAVDFDGTIYAGQLDALNPDGSLKWTFSSVSGSSLAVGPDGTIYVGGNGDIYGIIDPLTDDWVGYPGGSVYSSPAADGSGVLYFGGYAPGLGYPDVAAWSGSLNLWESPALGGNCTTTPALGGSYIYVGCDDYSLHGISSFDGSLDWSFATGGPVESSPAIGADGTIYFGSSDKYFYAVNFNGTLKWKFATSGTVDSSPAIGADGTIYFGSGDGNLYALAGGIAPTPTATVTAPPTATATATQTATPTLAPTLTPTPTQTPTLTPLQTPTPTQSPAPTPTPITPWPMFHHDIAHTGLSPYDTSANPGLEKWAFATGGQSTSAPAIGADDIIYFGSEDGNLYAVNPNGTLKWKFATGGPVDTSPAIGADGTIYVGVGAYTRYLYAVNPNGTQKWVFSLGAQNFVTGSFSSPAIGADGTIYVGSWDGNLYALTDGGQGSVKEKWSFVTGGAVYSSPAIGADGTIYVGSYDGNLYAITDGGQNTVTQKWALVAGGSVYSSPAIGADGTIYVGSAISNSYDEDLYAVKPDGTLKWVFATGYIGGSSPAIGGDGTIYIASSTFPSGNVYAVNPDGTEKWEFLTSGTVYRDPSIGADGTIYVGSDDYNVYAVNPNGTQKWVFATGGAPSPPAIGADGTIYFGDNDGNLYAVGACPCATPTPTATPTATQTATPTPTPTTSIYAPASLAFPNTPVGDTYAKNLTVKNTGHAPLFIYSVTSNDLAEFAATGATTCPSGGSGLAPGLTCTIAIGFTPNALGARSATLTLNDNTLTSPQRVALSGTGTITMRLSLASYGFGSVKDGSKAVKGVVVYNYQTNPVSLSESFSGPNAGDSSVTGGTCTATLAAKASCSLYVTYAPTAMGTESATMTVTDSPDLLSPYTVSFSAAETIPESLSATRLVFGNVYQTASKTLNVTVTNKATSGPITLTGTTIGGANAGDFAVTGGSCSGSLAASSSCTYSVTFTPHTESAEAGTFSIMVAQDPNGGPPAVGLSGTGLVPVRVVPVSVAFGTVVDGHSSTNRTVTVINDGGAAASLSESVTGTNFADFAVTGGTCTSTLAGSGASCTYLLKFTPSISGAESATLGVSASGDAASPHNVSLGGTGS